MSEPLDAVCLRRHDVGDYDAVVTFLTRSRGKIATMARGVKRPRSRKAPACQIFVRSRIELARGAPLPGLSQAVVEESFYALREDLQRSAYASYVCELCDRALPDEAAHAEVYELLVETLGGLTLAEDGAAVCHSFELRLLVLLGYEPALDRCARCGAPVDLADALFSPAAGGLVHRHEATGDSAAGEATPQLLAALRRLMDPEAYELDLPATRIPPELEERLRRCLRAYRRYHLEFEPRSEAFLDQLRALDPPD